MIKSIALTLSLAAAFSGTARAANMSQMTNSEKATMKECQSMSKSDMQNDKNCTALMQKYPDAMNGSSASGSMSGNSMRSNNATNNGGSR